MNSFSETFDVIGFEIGDRVYGAELTTLDEVLPLVNINPIPSIHSEVEGAINLRGKAIPIIKIAKFLGHEEKKPTDLSRIFIVTAGTKRLGFIVDSANKVLTFNRAEIEKAPLENEQNKFLFGLAKIEEGKMLMLIELHKIIPEIILNELDLSLKESA